MVDSGLVNSIEEFLQKLHEHEVEFYTKFITYKTNGFFVGNIKTQKRKPRIHWCLLDGCLPEMASTPYLLLGTRYYACHMGKCYFSSKLQHSNKIRENSTKRHYKKTATSKKLGCSAAFKVQRVIIFPTCHLENDTPTERARMGEYIKKHISSISSIIKYAYRIPTFSEHTNHLDRKTICTKEPIDKTIINKVKECVYKGIDNTLFISEIISDFVQKEYNISDKNRRRFYPSRSDLQQLIYSTQIKFRKSIIDIENLEKIQESVTLNAKNCFLQKSCNVEKASSLTDSSSSGNYNHSGLLFFYQNAQMKRLYSIYGQNCILIDPAYKFCKYLLPLFFVIVQTNVSYQIVAMFITEFESKQFLIKALTLLKLWNPNVHPQYALTQGGAEMKAVESVFPAIKVFIGSCYRENCWKRRLSLKDMALSKSEALSRLNQIANATTEDSLQKAIAHLKIWDYYNSSPLKIYYEKFWHKEIKRWSLIFKPYDIFFENYNYVDQLKRDIKYHYLSTFKHLSLSQMISFLCDDYLRSHLNNYVALNIELPSQYKIGDMQVPPFLHQCPHWIVVNLMPKLEKANKTVPYSFVEYVSEGHFFLQIKNEKGKYDLKFRPNEKVILCSCIDFAKTRIICYHALIIGSFYPQWNLEKIITWLMDFPIFKIDFDAKSMLSNKLDSRISEDANLNNQSSALTVSQDNCDEAIKKRCLDNIEYLKSLTKTLKTEDLNVFDKKLQEFSDQWQSLLSHKNPENYNSMNIESPPHSILEQISQIYKKDSRIAALTQRRYKKRKRKLDSTSQKKKPRHKLSQPHEESIKIEPLNVDLSINVEDDEEENVAVDQQYLIIEEFPVEENEKFFFTIEK